MALKPAKHKTPVRTPQDCLPFAHSRIFSPEGLKFCRPRWAAAMSTLSWGLDMANFEAVPVRLQGFEMREVTMLSSLFLNHVVGLIKVCHPFPWPWGYLGWRCGGVSCPFFATVSCMKLAALQHLQPVNAHRCWAVRMYGLGATKIPTPETGTDVHGWTFCRARSPQWRSASCATLACPSAGPQESWEPCPRG